VEYIYEPDPRTILDTVLPRFTELQIYQALLESLASEHSARMVAMRNATDNANELLGDLTLTYNRARQESITKEMLDIAGGAEALSRRGPEIGGKQCQPRLTFSDPDGAGSHPGGLQSA
jgi:F-type H+-transporting ATPase subunit gamma